MTVSQRLYLLLFLAALGLAGLARFGNEQMDKVYGAANFGNENTVPSVLTLNKAMNSFGQVRTRLYRHVLQTDSVKMAEIEAKIKEAQAATEEAYRKYEACCIADDTDRQMLVDDRAKNQQYNAAAEKILAFSRQNNKAEATDLAFKLVLVAQEVNDTLDKHMAYNESLGTQNSEAALVTKGQASKLFNSIAIGTVAILVLLGGFIIFTLKRALGGEPKHAAEIANKIAVGDLSSEIKVKSGDTTSLMAAMNRMSLSIHALTTDALMLSTAAVEGKLAARADAGKHQGEFHKIVDGVNATLDAVIGPLNVAAHYVDDIAKGIIPPKITDDYNGDFNRLKNNLNTCVEAIGQQAAVAQAVAAGDLSVKVNVRSENDVMAKSLASVIQVLNDLQKELQRLTVASTEGKLSERGKPEQFKGAYADVIKGVNEMLDAILLPIGEGNRILSLIRGGNLRERVEIACQGDHEKMKQAVNGVHGWLTDLIAYVTKMANGDMTAEMAKASNDDQIHEWLMLLKQNIQALVTDANRLSQAAVVGKLETRADASKHHGDFKKIVQGVNDTLDAVIGPLNVAAKYVDDISKGQIPQKITDRYNGDFNVLKNNLNTCIDAVNLLVSDAGLLSKAAIEGRLATRADADKHQGDFRKIVQGVNETLDAVIGPLNVAAKYVDDISKGQIPAKITDSYNGDFNVLKNNLNTCIDAVNLLVIDANLLSKAAVEGRLSTRADASKHQGDFRKIVQGVNETLDAVIGPLNVAAKYVDDISHGNIPEKITDSYNGDFNAIKNNLNTCIDAVNALVSDADMLAVAAVEGRLETRADASKHKGDFRKIVQGVNETLDAIISPLNDVVRVLGAMAQCDLTERIDAHYQGTFAKLKDDTNESVATLSMSLQAIQQGTDTINTAAKEISSGNADLSHRTEEQASSLEETASSMEQLSATVKQNADNAKQANQMARAASDVAVKGGGVVQEVVGTMHAINESSRKIVDIISVIDGIAFQTNILALNAAVEAARAGEQGRGFAVVAGEVRNLAQRSAAAAKEIKTLISDSVEKVEDGSRLVEEAGKTMDEVVTSVRRVTDIMSEIAAASVEQSSGIEQVNQAITQMDDVTQQNAALVEQAAAAAESLEEQAATMAETVAQFRLEGGRTRTKQLPPARQQPASHPASKPKAPKPLPVLPADDDDWSEF